MNKLVIALTAIIGATTVVSANNDVKHVDAVVEMKKEDAVKATEEATKAAEVTKVKTAKAGKAQDTAHKAEIDAKSAQHTADEAAKEEKVKEEKAKEEAAKALEAAEAAKTAEKK